MLELFGDFFQNLFFLRIFSQNFQNSFLIFFKFLLLIFSEICSARFDTSGSQDIAIRIFCDGGRGTERRRAIGYSMKQVPIIHVFMMRSFSVTDEAMERHLNSRSWIGDIKAHVITRRETHRGNLYFCQQNNHNQTERKYLKKIVVEFA